ncbi:unnamed protein product [Owenia fusiformis]|uniref:Uncharacterized protein n=1 Tax=Owenia fusiformis TaxID=6347 RepID=A0A8J1U611_OWEFU|nr:unnamed protein product [Owenia fusiformis]
MSHYERKIRTLFALWDTNKDGKWAFEDWEHVADNLVQFGNLDVEYINALKEKWHKIWEHFHPCRDEKSDAYLTEELLVTAFKGMASAKNGANDDSRKKIIDDVTHLFFDVVDTNHDGFISKEEFEVLYRSFGIQPYKPFALASFKRIDTNADGLISRDEFLATWEDYMFNTTDADNGNRLWGPLTGETITI